MKPKIFLVIALFALFGTQKIQAAQTPEQTARSFYRWYLSELDAERYPIGRQRTKMRSKVSKRLGRWLYSKAYEDYGADYIIQAQDWDSAWKDNIAVSKASVKGNTARLTVTLSGKSADSPDMYRNRLRITLLKEGRTWKIDRVSRLGES